MQLKELRLALGIFVAVGPTFVGMSAKADDPAPHAPPNVQTDPTPIERNETGVETSSYSQNQTSSSANEPTFETKTTRLTWPNVPLLATGATVLGAAYLPAIVGGIVSKRGDDKLYIPVAGPWLTLAKGPDESKGEKALLITDGIAQGIGALMLLASFVVPEKSTRHWYLIGSNDLQLSPARVGYAGYGMGASGRF
jgi:hypothetical protein